MHAFLRKYNSVKSEFGNKFISVLGDSSKKFNWPNGYGVYVIWEINPKSDDKLLYIGMTGKYIKKSNITVINGGKFNTRKGRWTPYCFCENNNENSFKYSPNYKIEKKNCEDINAYSNVISYDKIKIDFFVFSENIDENFGYTPTLLESLLLSIYLHETKDLPPANNEL